MEKGWLIWVLVGLLVGCGGESGNEEETDITDTAASAPAVGFAFDTPGGVREYETFVLTVRAVTETGETASDYAGSVSLGISAGEIVPSSVSLENGVGEIQTVMNRPGNLNLSAGDGEIEGTAPLTVWPAEWARTTSDAVLLGDSYTDSHWTYGGILSPSVIRGSEDQLWMFFSTTAGGAPDDHGVGHVLGRAVSMDEGASWAFEPDAPLWTPEDSGSQGLGAPTVWVDDTGSWHLWMGELGQGDVMTIGYATSSDGENWQRQDCLQMDENIAPYWASGGVDDPVVVQEGEQFRIYFTARAGMDSAASVIGSALGDCESGWSDFSIVLGAGEAGTWSAGGVATPFVWRESDVWKIFYSASASPTAKPTLGYAYSEDGLEWSPVDENPMMTKLGGWDVHGLEQPALVPGLENAPILFFNGLPTDKRPRVGRAIPNG